MYKASHLAHGTLFSLGLVALIGCEGQDPPGATLNRGTTGNLGATGSREAIDVPETIAIAASGPGTFGVTSGGVAPMQVVLTARPKATVEVVIRREGGSALLFKAQPPGMTRDEFDALHFLDCLQSS